MSLETFETLQHTTIRQKVLGSLIRSQAFDEAFYYDGPLGASYTAEQTTFRVWSPLAAKVELICYQDATPNSPIATVQTMTETYLGTFEVTLQQDCRNLVYSYLIYYAPHASVYSQDPYATGATVNGQRSVVIAPDDVALKNFKRLKGIPPTDAVIYELHIRDFSIDPNSGISQKGKYLGVVEEQTTTPTGQATGFDYLKELGVTHVEILPFYDFATVDETHLAEAQYNWGYDPLNYNVPEGSYSTDPYDPLVRIRELKQMIKKLHTAGIRVIMDVVYNHVYEPKEHPLHKTFPGYYFRYQADGELANGTGVGNDLASERKMMRKFIVDSVVYWAKNFHLDGFRFDLMGNLDLETMQAIRKALDEIDPTILLLGEGWDLATTLPAEKKAIQQNAQQIPRIAFFNDRLRDQIKGDVFSDQHTGFINGGVLFEPDLAQQLLAGAFTPTTPYTSPQQIIQYAEAHDNLTLFDKLVKTNPNDTPQQRIKRNTLGTSLVLLAQGIPFIQAGQEFLRTKQGDPNSYRSPDNINQLDWEQAASLHIVTNYFKQLIALRRTHRLFHLKSYEDIRHHARLVAAYDQLIVIRLFDRHNEFLLAFNASTATRKLPLIDFKRAELLLSNALPQEKIAEKKAHRHQQLLPLSATIFYHSF
ncbi:type I pullulanase [Enterococcus sp. CSURQ0835]|uniref:type I pullulanase n=1 Tax=Enterococcus sp. CSURQ0835 TaxID=2681394 RepID=UPI00135759B0|nr:type I pullulanase [Enterococcus sp. CSURQ0835]